MTALERVIRLNAAANAAGVRDSVLQFENIATQGQYRHAYAIAARYIAKGQRVLDWGCGNGHFSFFLQSLGARVTGYSFEAMPRCMVGAPEFTFIPGNEREPRRLPFGDAAFEAAVGVGVLEHVWETGGDERASLTELARVLEPGGTLLTFHLPNRSGWIEKVGHRIAPKRHFHRRKFDAAEIRALWAESGFEITSIGRYNALPRAGLHRLPAILRHSRTFAAFYDAIDSIITTIAPMVCTNFFVVAKKRPA